MPFEIPGAWAIGESDKALRVEVSELERDPVWIPKSQIHDDSEVWKAEQSGTLVVTDWWAAKQGWS